MDPELSNHVEKCRCCFWSFKNKGRKLLRITQKIRNNFRELTGIELTTSVGFSKTICGSCDKQIEAFAEFHLKMIKNQTRLYQYQEKMVASVPEVAKTEPTQSFVDGDSDVSEYENQFGSTSVRNESIDIEPWDQEEPNQNFGLINDQETHQGTQDSEMYVYEALDEVDFEFDMPTNPSNHQIREIAFKAVKEKTLKNQISMNYCEVCETSFCNPSSYKRHQLRRHRNIQYICDLCHLVMKTKNDVEKHMKKKHVSKKTSSYNYERMLSNDSSLKELYETLDETQGPICSFCLYADYDEDSLNEHLLTHQSVVDSGKMYCGQCTSPITSMQFFIEHTRDHNKKIKTHRCLVCNKSFPFDEKFLMHLQNHKKNESKISECPECGRRFSKPKLMLDHLRFIHRNQALFKCSVCGQGFGSKSALNGHVKRHIEGNKYQCPFCPKRFSSHNLLNSHKVVHSIERPFACTQCDKRFKHPRILNDHLKRHDGFRPVFTCNICSRSLNSSFALSRHMLIHSGSKPHQCTFCPKTYVQKNDLNKHLRSHLGENTYSCEHPDCGLHFRLLADLRLHEGVHYISEK